VAARLIVLGRQGAGKGTQCARLAARLGISHVSTGDLFRTEILARTPLGQELERYVAAGELVPDDVVLDVVAANLGNAAVRSAGYLLDGFPRTLAQGQALFEVLGADAADLAVDLDVPVDVVRARLGVRRVCVDCGTVTSVDAEAADRRCVPCGGRLQRRSDDHPTAIARRLDLFDQQSGPLLAWLGTLGILVRVDGEGDLDDVHDRIFAAVAQRLPAVRAIAR
jgi:adenylate kinase